ADLSMGWFDGIKVADLSFSDDAGQLSIQVKQIATKPYYGSILTGNLSFGRTLIDKPQVEINLKDRHVTEAKSPGQEPSTSGGLQPIVLPVKKIELVLNDGNMKVTDPKAGTVELSRINSKLNLQPPGRQTDFDLNMAVARAGKAAQIKVASRVTTKQQTGWSLKGTSGDLTVEVNDLDLESLAPIFALSGVEVQTKGLATGDLKSQIKDGRLENLTAEIKANNLDVTAAKLKGDKLQTANLDISVKLNQGKETIKIDDLRIKTDWASVTASGVVPTTFESTGDFLGADSNYNLKGDFNCDIAAISALMPKTLGLKEGMQITSGRLNGSVETSSVTGKRLIRANAILAGLEGAVDQKKVALSESIVARAEISSDKVGINIDKLDVSAPFAKINCTGRTESLKYNAEANLAKLQSELGQFINIGQYQISGEVAESGLISIEEDKIAASGSATVRNLRFSSKEGTSASEPMAEIDFAVDMDRKSSVVTIDSITANASFGQVSVENGVVPLNNKSAKPLRATIFASNVDLEKLLPFGVLFASLPKEMQLAGIAESTLSVGSDKDVYKIATDSTRIKGLKLVYPGQEKPFEQNEVTLAFEAEVDPNQKAVNVKKLQLDSPQIKIRKGEFSQLSKDGTTKLAGQAECEYDWSAVSALAAPYLPEGLTLQGKRTDAINFTSEYPTVQADKLLPNLNAEGKVGFEQADYMGLDFGPTDVEIQVQSGVLEVSPFTTTVNEGRFSFAGHADFKEKPPLFRIAKPMQMIKDIKVNDEITNKLLKYVNPLFADAVNVSGFANFNCEQLAIPLKAEAKNDAVVIGTISMNRLRMQGSNLVGQIFTTSRGDPRGTDMTIHPTRFVLQKGFLRYDNMQIDVGDNPVNFKGVIGLDKSLDMTVTLPYTSRGRTARIGRETSGRRVTLPLKGTVDKPELDMGKLLEEQLKGQLEEQLRKGLEDLFK
ncbi:MAG: AsmA family protein, partial [Planctomycetota bacterium]